MHQDHIVVADMVAEMVAADIEEAKKEAYLKRNGFDVVGSRE